MGFPDGSDGKQSACNVRDLSWIPGSGRLPGEGNGNHSSILAWKTPWTEKPGRLQSIGLQRVGHDLLTSLSLSYTHMYVCMHRHIFVCVCIYVHVCVCVAQDL